MIKLCQFVGIGAEVVDPLRDPLTTGLEVDIVYHMSLVLRIKDRGMIGTVIVMIPILQDMDQIMSLHTMVEDRGVMQVLEGHQAGLSKLQHSGVY